MEMKNNKNNNISTEELLKRIKELEDQLQEKKAIKEEEELQQKKEEAKKYDKISNRRQRIKMLTRNKDIELYIASVTPNSMLSIKKRDGSFICCKNDADIQIISLGDLMEFFSHKDAKYIVKIVGTVDEDEDSNEQEVLQAFLEHYEIKEFNQVLLDAENILPLIENKEFKAIEKIVNNVPLFIKTDIAGVILGAQKRKEVNLSIDTLLRLEQIFNLSFLPQRY